MSDLPLMSESLVRPEELDALSQALGCKTSDLRLQPLAHQGAINQHFALTLKNAPGAWVYRRAAVSALEACLCNAWEDQAAWHHWAHRHGMPTPGIRAVVPGYGLVLQRLQGEARPAVLARLPAEQQRRRLAPMIKALARLHAQDAPSCARRLPADAWVADWPQDLSSDLRRQWQDIQRHMQAQCFPSHTPIHGDFRYGNLLDDKGQLFLLDYDFARWGWAAEDLGWLTASCWIYSPLQAQALDAAWVLDCYNSAARQAVTAEQLADAQIMALYRWTRIALAQQARFHETADALFYDCPQQHPGQTIPRLRALLAL